MLIRPSTGFRDPRQLTKLKTDLISWWPLDDFNHSTAISRDVISGQFITGDGAPTRGIAQAYNGKRRGAAAFNNGLGMTGLTTSTSLPSSTWHMGITAWVWFNTVNNSATLYSLNDGTAKFVLNLSNAGVPRFQINNSTGTNQNATGATVLKTNRWYLFGGTFTGTSATNGLKFWINALVDGQATVASPPTATTIAAAPTIGGGHIGYVDDVRVYWRELTTGDMRALMAEAYGPVYDVETIALMRSVSGPKSITISFSQAQGFTLSKAVGKQVTTIASAEAMTLASIRSRLRTNVITSSSQVTLARVNIRSGIITFAQTQLVTLRKSAGKLLTFTQAQLVTLRKSVSHAVAVTQAQLVTLIGQKSFLRTLSTITQAQLVTLSKSAGKLLTFTQAQVVTRTALMSYRRTLTVTQAQLITLPRFVSRTITVTQAQLVSARKAVARFMALITQAQVVTLTKSAGKVFSITQAQAITLSIGKAFVRVMTLVQAQVVSGSANATINLAAFYMGLSELVTVARVKGTGAASKTITFVQNQLVTLTTTKALSWLINLTQAQLVTLSKLVTSTIAFTQAQLVTLLKVVGHGISFASTQLVTLAVQKSFLRTISIVQAQLVTLTKSVSKLITLTQAQLVTLVKSAGKLILITQSQLVTLRKSVGKLLSLTQAQLVTLSVQKSFLRTISIVQAQLVTLTRAVSYLRTITITQAQLVTLSRTAGKLITLTQAQLITLRKAVSKLLSLTQAQLVTLSVQKAFLRTISFVQTQLVTLTTKQALLRTISIVQGQLVTLQKSTSKFVTFTQAQLVTLSKQVGKVVSFVQSQLVTLNTVFQRAVVTGKFVVQYLYNLTVNMTG